MCQSDSSDGVSTEVRNIAALYETNIERELLQH